MARTMDDYNHGNNGYGPKGVKVKPPRESSGLEKMVRDEVVRLVHEGKIKTGYKRDNHNN